MKSPRQETMQSVLFQRGRENFTAGMGWCGNLLENTPFTGHLVGGMDGHYVLRAGCAQFLGLDLFRAADCGNLKRA